MTKIIALIVLLIMTGFGLLYNLQLAKVAYKEYKSEPQPIETIRVIIVDGNDTDIPQGVE